MDKSAEIKRVCSSASKLINAKRSANCSSNMLCRAKLKLHRNLPQNNRDINTSFSKLELKSRFDAAPDTRKGERTSKSHMYSLILMADSNLETISCFIADPSSSSSSVSSSGSCPDSNIDFTLDSDSLLFVSVLLSVASRAVFAGINDLAKGTSFDKMSFKVSNSLSSLLGM